MDTTTTTTRILTLARSRTGAACLWESGGGMTNTGESQIVAGPQGEALSPIYIRRAGSLAGSEHALIPVRVGSVVVTASHHRGDFCLRVEEIVTIDGDEARLRTLATFERGEWSSGPAPWLVPAIEAAQEKARCWHCREPHYIA